MGRILLVAETSGLAARVTGGLAAAGHGVEAVERPAALFPLLHRHRDEVELVVLGAGVRDPVHLAQQIARVDPRLEILVAGASEAAPARVVLLAASPFLGPQVRTVRLAEDADALVAELAEAAARTRERRASALRGDPEEQLRRSQQFLDSIVENLPHMIFVKEATELRFVRLNQAGEELLGIPREEMYGKNDHDFFPPDEAGFFTAKDREVLAGTGVVDIAEEPLRSRTKGPRWLHTRKIPLRDEHGVPRYLLGISEDITERKRAEEELRRTAAELARSNADLQDFAYVASHDLQEPLRKIRAFGERLGRRLGPSLDDEGRMMLSRMTTAAERMQRLIDDLLAFSRVAHRGGAFGAVDLAAVVAEVVEDLEPRLVETGGRIEVGPLPRVVADVGQMRQLFQNLLANGLKFHRPGVAPRVRVAEEALAPGRAPGGPVRIVVEDEGIGFEDRYAERIFAPFQRLHGRDEYPGTGIGLTICRRIAERHGGGIVATGEPGRGARFVVELGTPEEA